MTLSEYIEDPQKKQKLAEDLGTSPAYLWQLATSWRGKRPSVDFAKRIEKATGGQVEAAILLGLNVA